MARGSSGVRHLELTFTMSGVYNLSGASRVRVSDLFSFNIIFNPFRVPGTVELMVLCEIAPFMYASRSPKSILDIIINSFFYFYSLSLRFIWNCLLYLSYRPMSVTFACSRSLHSMFFFFFYERRQTLPCVPDASGDSGFWQDKLVRAREGDIRYEPQL